MTLPTQPPPIAPRAPDSPAGPGTRVNSRQSEITARVEAHLAARRLDMAEAVFGLSRVAARVASTEPPQDAPRDTDKDAQIKDRLDAFTEATRRLSEAVANGARPPGMWSSKATEEDR